MRKLYPDQFPHRIKEINDPPKKLYVEGTLPPEDHKWLAVVGSRKYTSYGREACEKLIIGLRGYPIAIVSGLALGIDGIAHEAALKAGLKTIAVPGSGLDKNVLYPRTHRNLARKIVEGGGALLSEFEPNFAPTAWSFPERNRIMAGLSDAVLLVEAEKKSGTMITGKLAADYNRDLLVVPGSIFSKTSEGPHLFMKLGAKPVTDSKDIIEALGLTLKEQDQGELALIFDDCSDEEKRILNALAEPMTRDTLIEELSMNVSMLNSTLSLLELKGLIKEEMGEVRRV